MRQPAVEVTAGGSVLVLFGTLKNSGSVPATVLVPGWAFVPLEAAVRVLGTYPRAVCVTPRTESGRIWLDKLSLSVTENS
ncbi:MULTISPECIES: hypothetical protein [unclassified Luteimonas]|uniref:hypothetical protein n=1 Tax=unclassified Luteimonas TaxID=2629088 RepID=UPI000478C021|nr:MULTISPECIES: hypothetical protein [unclassified Luteimonas]